jgi:uncharacterized membrane protein YhfC
MKTQQLIVIAFLLISISLLVVLGITQPDTIVPALSGFLMIGLGLGLGYLFNRRLGLPWGLFGAGALTMITSQVVHIPFNAYLLNPLLRNIAPQPVSGSNDLIFWGILLGLSAGIFEETARYLVLRFWRKDVQSWRQVIMFGAGHGGIEAIIIGVFAFAAFIQLSVYRQYNPQALSQVTDGTQLQALQMTLKTYWESNWYEHLWGSLERFSVLPVHLSAAVLVYQSLCRKNLKWFLVAVLWHAVVDFLAVFGSKTWGIPVTEALLFALGVIGWGIVFILRDSSPTLERDEVPPPPETIKPAPVQEVPARDNSITKESLEESRYE